MDDVSPAVKASEKGFYSEAEVTGIFIATPAYGGVLTTGYVDSLVETIEYIRSIWKIPVGRGIIDGDSFIQRARNTLTSSFMADKIYSHMVSIDSDIIWQPKDLMRLIAHDVEMIGGIYPKKQEPIDFPFHPHINENGLCDRNPTTGAVKISSAPTGFLCLKRSVFEKMREAYPHLKFILPGVVGEQAEWLYEYFGGFVEDGILWSEDYGFSKRWRAIGGEIWCDPEIRLCHIGKKVYEGALADFISAPGSKSKPLTEEIHGWKVPFGDPWFGPQLRETEGCMDREIIAKTLNQVREFGVAIDVGAHIGTWTRTLATRFEKVVAIEPNPEMVKLLKANLEGMDNVEIIQAAAWCRDTFLRGRAIGFNSGEFIVQLGPEVNEELGIAISGISIDNRGLEWVDLIKIDVEGTELLVLRGAVQTIMRCHPVIVLEQGHDTKAVAWLEELGMHVVARIPIAPDHPVENVVLVWSNV